MFSDTALKNESQLAFPKNSTKQLKKAITIFTAFARNSFIFRCIFRAHFLQKLVDMLLFEREIKHFWCISLKSSSSLYLKYLLIFLLPVANILKRKQAISQKDVNQSRLLYSNMKTTILQYTKNPQLSFAELQYSHFCHLFPQWLS